MVITVRLNQPRYYPTGPVSESLIGELVSPQGVTINNLEDYIAGSWYQGESVICLSVIDDEDAPPYIVYIPTSSILYIEGQR
jgi:hypothetical protein